MKQEITRTSLSIPNEYLRAMELIKNKEEVLKSSQVRMGLKLYFERHRDLLAEHGISIPV